MPLRVRNPGSPACAGVTRSPRSTRGARGFPKPSGASRARARRSPELRRQGNEQRPRGVQTRRAPAGAAGERLGAGLERPAGDSPGCSLPTWLALRPTGSCGSPRGLRALPAGGARGSAGTTARRRWRRRAGTAESAPSAWPPPPRAEGGPSAGAGAGRGRPGPGSQLLGWSPDPGGVQGAGVRRRGRGRGVVLRRRWALGGGGRV